MPFITHETITKTYLARVEASPKRVGFVFKPTYPEAGPKGRWRRITYAEHFKLCREVSAGLTELQIHSGDRAAILSNTRFEWQLCDMAILGSKAITVPIYASLTPQEVAYILNHSEAKCVFVENEQQLKKIQSILESDPKSLPHLKSLILIEPSTTAVQLESLEHLSLSQLREKGQGLVERDPEFFAANLLATQPQDLITICYTSGTTGVPKGAMLSHDNMMAIIEAAIQLLGEQIQEEGRVGLTFLPFSHVVGKVESMFSYAIGMEQWFAESIEKLGPNMAKAQPEILFGVPRIFEKAHTKILGKISSKSPAQQKIFDLAVLAAKRYWLKTWQGKDPNLIDRLTYGLAKKGVFQVIREQFGGRLLFCLCGGAPFAREIGEFFYYAGVKVCEGYGLTETCAPVTLNPPQSPKFGTVGPLLPGVEVKIAEEDGEILLKGRQIFQGYYKNPEATDAVFKEGWFCTGDIGHLDSQSYLKITDRKKDLLVTSGGKNIAPQKIENLAKTQALISQLVVLGDKRKYLTALLTLDEPQTKSYAKKNSISFKNFKELTQTPQIRSRVQESINQVNKQLPSFETLKKFTIIPEDFTVENGCLTPSLKVKRKVISERYGQEIEGMY